MEYKKCPVCGSTNLDSEKSNQYNDVACKSCGYYTNFTTIMEFNSSESLEFINKIPSSFSELMVLDEDNSRWWIPITIITKKYIILPIKIKDESSDEELFWHIIKSSKDEEGNWSDMEPIKSFKLLEFEKCLQYLNSIYESSENE